MRRLWILIVVFLFPLQLAAAAEPARKPGDLYLLGIATQDDWDFLPVGLESVFREQGAAFYQHMHSRQLVGKEATRKELMDGLTWLRRHATADDLVIIFIGCHGNCVVGESVFHTRDGEVRPQEVKKELAKLPCQAIVVNDACESGNWPQDRPDDPMPPNVTALCCCLATQSSQFEFDIALFEALYGRADFNQDGVVDLDEVIRYCELRIKEIQGGRLTPVLRKAKTLKGALPLTKVAPNLVGVIHEGEVWTGLLGKQDGDRYHVRIIGADSHRGENFVTDSVTRDHLYLPADGPALMVKMQKDWYPARLLSQDGKQYKIRYLGAKNQEEVVEEQRVRHLFAGKPGEAFPLNPPEHVVPFLGIGGPAIDAKVKVAMVVEGSPAATAGLKADDVILSFGGKKVTSDAALRTAIREHKIGEKVPIEVQRGPKTIPFEVTLGQQSVNRPDAETRVELFPEAERAAVRSVKELGGEVGQEDEGGSAVVVNLSGTPLTDEELLRVLTDLKGLKKLRTLTLVGCGKLTDRGLKEVKDLTSLQTLFLGGTQLTDAGLKELKVLRGLRQLGLARTQVTDAGLKELNDLKELQTLFLAETKVTDSGLKELHNLKALQQLFLAKTKVTDAGVADLEKALPKLKIER